MAGADQYADAGQRSGGRTFLEKLLLFLLLLNTGALIALAVFIGTNSSDITCSISDPSISGSASNGGPPTHAPTSAPHGTSPPAQATQPEVCTTKECVTAAANLIESLDERVSPCDDFHQFACGGWEANRQIPESRSRYSSFSSMGDVIDRQLRVLLESPSSGGEESYIQKAKDFYAACVDYDHVTSLGPAPVRQFLQELGGWPLVTSGWSDMTFALDELLVKVNKYNILPVVWLYVDTDLMNPSTVKIALDQPDFGLPGQKYYTGGDDNKKYITAYRTLIYKVAELVGFANATSAAEDVDQIIAFETKLANISATDEERRDPYSMYNPMTLKDTAGNYTIDHLFNMTNYVITTFGLPGVDIHDITERDVIINMAPGYYSKLVDLLKVTPKRTIANYVVWRSVLDNIGSLSPSFRSLYLDYRQVVFGVRTELPRHSLCINYVNSHMGVAAGRMFLDKFFPTQAKSTANEMIDHLQSAFNAHLSDINWMDSKTKDQARVKNNAISRRIGYPDSTLNTTYLNTYYGKTGVSRSTFFTNVLHCKLRAYLDDNSRFRKPLDKSRWSEPPQTVNAYYSPDKNQITFPAGILQPPFFQVNYPKYLNFGAMGVVIGHEITHGFDDEGRQFDQEGRLNDWWTPTTSGNYDSRAGCIVQQYSNFSITLGGKVYHLNGETMQGENIADNGGLKISYAAYKAWAASQPSPEPKLPGLKYTPEQLFFMNFGQAFCGLYRPESIIRLIKTDPHPPGQFRIQGSVQNMPDFGRVFQCPLGSKMNPALKCSLW